MLTIKLISSFNLPFLTDYRTQGCLFVFNMHIFLLKYYLQEKSAELMCWQDSILATYQQNDCNRISSPRWQLSFNMTWRSLSNHVVVKNTTQQGQIIQCTNENVISLLHCYQIGLLKILRWVCCRETYLRPHKFPHTPPTSQNCWCFLHSLRIQTVRSVRCRRWRRIALWSPCRGLFHPSLRTIHWRSGGRAGLCLLRWDTNIQNVGACMSRTE